MAGAKYRMIAIDLDGTLLSPDGKVTDRCKAAVHGALKAGLLVCFATGRNWTESRTVLEAVEHYDTAVFVGGAMVVDTEKQVTLHRTMMQPELAAELCAYLESEGQAAMALQDTGTAGVDYLLSAEVEPNEAVRQWMGITSAAIHRAPGLGSDPSLHEHTIRVGICAAPDDVQRVTRGLAERFGEQIVV